MLCTHCAATVRQTARVCIRCGNAVSSAAASPEPPVAGQGTADAQVEPVMLAGHTPTSIYEAAPELSSASRSMPADTEPAALHALTLFDFGDASEAVVTELLVQVGDTVGVDQTLLCVETEEFIFEVPSDCDGEVRTWLVKVGDTVRRHQPLAEIWGVRHVPSAAAAPPAESPTAPTPPGPPAGVSTIARSTWGWSLLGVALLGSGYLMVQALNPLSLPDSASEKPSQPGIAALEAPPPVSGEPNTSPVVLNIQDLNALLRMAASDDWSGVRAVLRDKRPQTHAVKDKGTARSMNQAGLDLINQGDWTSAQSMFEQALVANANDPEIHNHLGFVELRLRRHSQAQVHLVNTLLMAPARTNAWSNLAELMAETGEPTTAAAALRLAVHFSRNQKRTLEFLADPARVPSTALREVIQAHWAAIAGVPAYVR